MFEQNEIIYLQNLLLLPENANYIISDEENIFLHTFFTEILNSNLPNIDKNLVYFFYYLLNNKHLESHLHQDERLQKLVDLINQGMHFTRISKFFLFLLKHNLVYVAEQIWNKNEAFANYFSGNVHTTFEHKNYKVQTCIAYQIESQEVISNFKAALKAQANTITDKMWSNNIIVKNYYCQNPTEIKVYRNTNNIFTALFQADFYESIELFVQAINLKNINIVTMLWDNNQIIREYYSGEPIIANLHRNGLVTQKTETPSLEELNIIFKKLLSLNIPRIVLFIWEKNTNFCKYFSGKEAYSINSDITNNSSEQTLKLNLDDAVENLKLVICNNYSVIAEYIWDENPTVASYFSGLETPFKITDIFGNEVTHNIKISYDMLIANAKLVIENNVDYIIKKMLKNNKFLQNYIFGIPQNIIEVFPVERIQPRVFQISFLEMIYNFKKFLNFNRKDICLKILTKNPNVVKYFYGIELEIFEHEFNRFTKIHISDQEIIEVFRLAITNEMDIFANTMWETHKFLQDYYCGEEIQINVTDTNNHVTKQNIHVKSKDLADIFSKSTKTNKNIALEIWNRNKKFSKIFCGHILILKNIHTGKQEYLKVPSSQLIDNFKLVALNKCSDIVNDMLKENSLIEIIKNLNCRKLRTLINTVLNSYEGPAPEYVFNFIVNYSTIGIVNYIYNQKAQQKEQQKAPSDLLINQLELLKKAQQTIQDNLLPVTNSFISNQSIFATSNKKRNYSVDLTSSSDANEEPADGNANKYQKL